MTEERQHTDAGPTSDALVSEIYRDSATERAPDRLNRAVLRTAAGAARPRYGRLRSWTRPMAWAATVILSVALVLEVAKVPESPPLGFEDTAATFEAASEAGETEAISDAEVLRKQHSVRGDQVQERVLTAPEAAVDEFKVPDKDMLRQAEDMARMRSGQNRETAAPGTAAGGTAGPALESVSTLSSVAVSPTCDEAATASPETWLECIEEMEAVGFTAEAQEQRELLREAFPEFEMR